MLINEKKYKAGKTLAKAAIAFAAVCGASAATAFLDEVMAQLPDSVEGFTLPVILGLVAFVIKGAINWWKNHNKGAGRFPGIFLLAGAVGALACMQGCATSMPSLRGRTTYDVEFRNITPESVAEDGSYIAGEITEYACTIKAPAGVELTDLAGMAITTEAGGAYSMGVNQEKTLSSQGQADIIPAAAAIDAQMITAIAATVAQVAIEAALPGYLANTAAGVAKAEIKASSQAEMMRTVKDLIADWQTPATP